MGGLRRHPAGSPEADAAPFHRLLHLIRRQRRTASHRHSSSKQNATTSFLPPTSAHPLLSARLARNKPPPAAAHRRRRCCLYAQLPRCAVVAGCRMLTRASVHRRTCSPIVQRRRGPRGSRRAQRIPSLAAHLLASSADTQPPQCSVRLWPARPARRSWSAAAVARRVLPSCCHSLLLLCRCLHCCSAAQTVVSPKHSSRRLDTSDETTQRRQTTTARERCRSESFTSSQWWRSGVRVY